jgi:hypothetical protein
MLDPYSNGHATYNSQSKHIRYVGRDSSVGIVTRYGLDGPGIESLLCVLNSKGQKQSQANQDKKVQIKYREKKSGTGRDFSHQSRRGSGAKQPPKQWVLRLFPGGKVAAAWS